MRPPPFSIVVLIFTLLSAGYGFGQDSDSSKQIVIKSEKTEIFRHLLYRANIESLSNLDQAIADPRNSIVILLGNESINRYLDGQLRLFVEQGGSLLVASDQRSTNFTLARSFGVIIIGNTVEAAPEDCYHGRKGQPFVRPIRALFDNDKTSPKTIFKDLDGAGEGALATNIASVLRIISTGASKPEPLAAYPFSSWVQNPANRLDSSKDLFAAGGHREEGRFLVLADHSVFVNGMVWKFDNANLFFTRDCISWLQGEEKKSRCLFIEDGIVRTEFELPTLDKDESELDFALKIMKFLEMRGNSIVSEAEERNLHNNWLLSMFPRGLRDVLRLVVIVGTCIVAVFGFMLLLRGRTAPDPARTLVTPALAALIPRGNVLRQRFDSLLGSDNIYESARQLVREFLAGLDAEPDARGQPPQVEIRDGYEDEPGLRRRIMRLWRIGYGTEPVRVAPSEWPTLGKDLKDVLLDADEGWWKFSPAV